MRFDHFVSSFVGLIMVASEVMAVAAFQFVVTSAGMKILGSVISTVGVVANRLTLAIYVSPFELPQVP